MGHPRRLSLWHRPSQRILGQGLPVRFHRQRPSPRDDTGGCSHGGLGQGRSRHGAALEEAKALSAVPPRLLIQFCSRYRFVTCTAGNRLGFFLKDLLSAVEGDWLHRPYAIVLFFQDGCLVMLAGSYMSWPARGVSSASLNSCRFGLSMDEAS